MLQLRQLFIASLVVSTITLSASKTIAAVNLNLGIVANDGFEIGSTNNDGQSEVNADTMFGFSDWLFAQKEFDTDPIAIDIGFEAIRTVGDDAAGTSGTWSINDVWDTYDDVMIVLKGGNSNNTDPGNYVGYLLQQDQVSGSYDSPFTQKDDFSKVKNISHISIYVRTAIIPEPSSLGISSLGLVTAFGRRRRRS